MGTEHAAATTTATTTIAGVFPTAYTYFSSTTTTPAGPGGPNFSQWTWQWCHFRTSAIAQHIRKQCDCTSGPRWRPICIAAHDVKSEAGSTGIWIANPSTRAEQVRGEPFAHSYRSCSSCDDCADAADRFTTSLGFPKKRC